MLSTGRTKGNANVYPHIMGSIICIVFVVRVIRLVHIFTITLMNNLAHENVRLDSMNIA